MEKWKSLSGTENGRFRSQIWKHSLFPASFFSVPLAQEWRIECLNGLIEGGWWTEHCKCWESHGPGLEKRLTSEWYRIVKGKEKKGFGEAWLWETGKDTVKTRDCYFPSMVDRVPCTSMAYGWIPRNPQGLFFGMNHISIEWSECPLPKFLQHTYSFPFTVFSLLFTMTHVINSHKQFYKIPMVTPFPEKGHGGHVCISL